MLIRIDSGYFVAGVVLKDNTVVRAAPILRYMIGWTGDAVCRYAKKKHWEYDSQQG